MNKEKIINVFVNTLSLLVTIGIIGFSIYIGYFNK